MVGFIIGLFVGGFFGVVTMCILSVAGRDDDMREENQTHNDEQKKDNNSDFNDIIGLE